MTRQTLIIDADDTLWENNVYFERVIDQFIEFVNHQHYSREQVRQVLNQIERVNAAVYGYGSATFTRNLQEAFRRLAAAPISDRELDQVAGLAGGITRQPLEVIEGVPATLEYLAERHKLVLFTKGDEEEQRGKLRRSGLARFFSESLVVREKDEGTYRRVTADLEADPAGTWMIGNSPRSDVNPALAAGLNAVWVPHSATWVLEQEQLRGGPGRLVVVARFAELRDIF